LRDLSAHRHGVVRDRGPPAAVAQRLERLHLPDHPCGYPRRDTLRRQLDRLLEGDVARLRLGILARRAGELVRNAQAVVGDGRHKLNLARPAVLLTAA